MPKKYLEPKVFITCHFCGAHLHYEVTVDTYKIWQAKVHPCAQCFNRLEGVKLDLSEVSACCTYPAGDGSTCAGGICQCDPPTDYTCDKCKRSDRL